MAAQSSKDEIEGLIARSQSARDHLTHNAMALRARLDAPARMRKSLRAHPTAWLAGAAATGIATSRILFGSRRPRLAKSKHTRSLPFFLLKMLANTTMPALKILLLSQLKSYIHRSSSPPTIPNTH